MSEGKTYLTIKLATQYLKISRGVAYKLVREQAIPSHKIGQKILFIREELDQWIERKTLREKEEKVTAEEKLLRRLDPFWNYLSIDTQDEINERINTLYYWLDDLARVVKRVEETKGKCHFREADCLLKKQTQSQRYENRSPGTETKQQSRPTPNQRGVQAGPGSPQPSGQDHPRRPHIRRKDRPRRRPHELTQQKPATSVEAPPKKDAENGIPHSTGSHESEIPIEAKAPSQAEKSSQVVPESQKKVPAEHPSSSTAQPLDQPGEDPLSHAQTVDSAGP